MATRVVSALTKEYARLRGRYEVIEREIEYVVGVENILKETQRIELERFQIQKRLDEIAALVHGLDPTWVREKVKPIYPNRREHGSFARVAYQILREAKSPLKTRDISRIAAERLGIEPIQRELNRLDNMVMGVLKPRIGKTVIVLSGKPRRWAFMSRDQAIAALRASQATPAPRGKVLPLQPKAAHPDNQPTVSETPPQSRIAGSHA
jgi:hypothetical protein